MISIERQKNKCAHTHHDVTIIIASSCLCSLIYYKQSHINSNLNFHKMAADTFTPLLIIHSVDEPIASRPCQPLLPNLSRMPKPFNPICYYSSINHDLIIIIHF